MRKKIAARLPDLSDVLWLAALVCLVVGVYRSAGLGAALIVAAVCCAVLALATSDGRGISGRRKTGGR